MKLNQILILGLLILTFKSSKLNAKIIHVDPYDIRRTSVNAGFLFSGPRGFGAFFNASYYVKPNMQLLYSGNFFPLVFMDDKFHDAEPSRALVNDNHKSMLMYNSFGVDFHFYDKKRPKTTQVVLHSSSTTIGEKTKVTNTVEEVHSFKRHVWSLYTGVMTMTGREGFYKEDTKKVDRYEMVNISNNQTVNVANNSGPDYMRSVFTTTAIYNLEIGIKNKGIFATAVEHEDYGRKWQDAYAEWYLTGLLPLTSSFEEVVRRNGTPNTAYKIISDIKPKPGFKLGFNFRTSVKSNIYMGGDFGFLPSITQKSGNVLHFSFRLGYNLNFGKIKLEEITK